MGAYVTIDWTNCLGIHIAENVVIKDHVLLMTFDPDKDCNRDITICRNAVIGEHSIILPGVTVGENCVVFPGTLVDRDVPAHQWARGNPMVTEEPQ